MNDAYGQPPGFGPAHADNMTWAKASAAARAARVA